MSPNVNGLQVMLGHSLQVDKNGADDFPGVTEYAVRYTAGALDLMGSQSNVDIGSAAPANSSLNANSSFRFTALAGSFAVSPTIRLHAGMGSSKSANLATNFNSRWNNLGASIALTPTISAMANISSVNDTSSLNMDRGLTGVGLNYALSKRSRAYVRYETLVTDKENKSVAGNKQTITAVGVSHTF
jgi:predicted porin